MLIYFTTDIRQPDNGIRNKLLLIQRMKKTTAKINLFHLLRRYHYMYYNSKMKAIWKHIETVDPLKAEKNKFSYMICSKSI